MKKRLFLLALLFIVPPFPLMFVEESLPFPLPPSHNNWLGSDLFGHDVLWYALKSAQTLVVVASVISIISFFVGVIIGFYQGMGLKGSSFFNYVSNLCFTLPLLYLLLILNGYDCFNIITLSLSIISLKWMRISRFISRLVAQKMQEPVLINAAFMGVPLKRQITHYLWPFLKPHLKAWAPFFIVRVMSMITVLDFLKLGLPLEYASLGRLIAQGREALFAPWILLTSVTTFIFLQLLFLWPTNGYR